MAHGATYIGRLFQGGSWGQDTGAGGGNVAHGTTQSAHVKMVVVYGGLTLEVGA
jgi:hypothetical protein